ncbi:MAG TPA: SPOR domain-containing protein, partial [Bacteroidales bacterium]|nr:SPOR domain-containing protein [Bacteroidales bacterium]
MWIILLSLILAPVVQAGPSFTKGTENDPAVSEKVGLPITIISTFPTELTVEGLISLSKSNFPLQLGAFSRKKNAEALAARLKELLSIEVEVVNENDLFKVMINHSTDNEAVCYFIPVDFSESGKTVETEVHPYAAAPEPVSVSIDEVQSEQPPEPDTVALMAEAPD